MAGLLDGYQFDPQTYGGGGGLLAQLAQQYGIPLPGQEPQGFAVPKGDYLGSTGQPDPRYAQGLDMLRGAMGPAPLAPPVNGNVPSLQVAGTPAGAGGPSTDLSSVNRPVPQAAAVGQGGGGDQNPIMGLLGSIGGGLSNLFSGGASPAYAQAGPAPGAGQQPGIPAQAAAGPAGPGFLGRLQAGTTNLSTGGNLFSGLANAISGFSTGERTDQQSIALQNQANTANALYGALLKSGRYSPEEAKGIAIAASTNQGLATAILPQAFGSKYEGKVVKDLVGEHIEAFDPITGTTKSTAGGGGGDTGVGGPTVLAPGVKKYDPYLGPEEYMAQFSPDMQSAIKMQIKGDAMPTGNPRLQGLWPTAKGFAALYADKAGIPFSDAIYNAKRVMRTGLAQSSNTSIGGILANGDSSFKHLGELGESFADLGNYAGPNIPGGAYIGEAGNVVGNTMFPTPKIRGKIAAIADNSLRFGQEATKFYAGSGGGEAERLLALKTVGGPGTNAEVQAAFLAKEKSLMLDRLNSKLQDVRQTLGDDEAQKIIADKMPSLNNSVAKIDAAIAKLRGEAAPQQGTASQQAPAAALPKITTQAEYSKLSKGTQYIAPDGNVRTKQ